MSAFRRAVLSVNPDRLEQFTNEMKKNISDTSNKKVSRRDRSPSDSSSKRSQMRKRHSKSRKVSSKSSPQSAKGSESKEEKSSKSTAKDSTKRRKLTSSSFDKKGKEDSDFDDKDLDLSNPLSSLTTMIKDRKTLLDTAFSIIQGPKFTAILSDNLKAMPLHEVKRMCYEHLNVMSSKRIFHVLSGISMDSSSGTDSSGDERPAKFENRPTMPTQEHTLQTNLVDSTTSENTGPSMLFPSALSTAQCGMPEDRDATPLSKTGLENTPTSTSPTRPGIGRKCSSASKSEAEEGELETFLPDQKDGKIPEIAQQVSEAKNLPANIEEVFVEEVEEIEETMEDQIQEDVNDCEIETADRDRASALENTPDVDYSGKTQLEILELELRARAIRSLMKAAKAGSLKTAPSEK